MKKRTSKSSRTMIICNNYTQEEIAGLKKAAKDGNSKAMYDLYLWLTETAEDLFEELEAAYWLNLSAGAGYADAEQDLAERYATGENVRKDADKARYWRNRSRSHRMAAVAAA